MATGLLVESSGQTDKERWYSGCTSYRDIVVEGLPANDTSATNDRVGEHLRKEKSCWICTRPDVSVSECCGRRDRIIDPDLPFATYCLPRRILFGGYPSESDLVLLRNRNVTTILDLTVEHVPVPEEYYAYRNRWFRCLRYPIIDHQVPSGTLSFCSLIVGLASSLLSHPQENIYIHCRGGHGRSVLVSAILLHYLFRRSFKEIIEWISWCHNLRPSSKIKWKQGLYPQNAQQRHFLRSMCQPIYYPIRQSSDLEAKRLLSFVKYSQLRPIYSTSSEDCKALCSLRSKYFLFVYNTSSWINKRQNVLPVKQTCLLPTTAMTLPKFWTL